MQFDFTTQYDRRGKDAIAIDGVGKSPTVPQAPQGDYDLIPMWVADMNFATVPTAIEAIQKRLEHPLFGYFAPSDAFYDAVINWHRVKKGVNDLQKEYIGYENGVVGGVISSLKVFAAPGDPVLIHTPVYTGFRGHIPEAGFRPVYSPLYQDEEGVWRMDYEDMDRKIKEHHIHVAILCNPHNPTGRAWSREELTKALAVYEQNDVYVISDEIWSDIILEGQQFVPTQQVNAWAKDHTVALYAPSKTFNLAGLCGSYHVIYNKTIREREERIAAKLIYNKMNVLWQHALIGAYSETGLAWTKELCQVLTENAELAYRYITEKFPGVETTMPQATYMMFLDATAWCEAHGKTIDELLKRGWDCGIAWQDGRQFQGPCHIRLNLASPTTTMEKAFQRMDEEIFNQAW